MMKNRKLILWWVICSLMCIVAGCDNEDVSPIPIGNRKVTIDGLHYYLFPDTHEAVIDNENICSGELDIPSKVKYNGQTFTVNGMAWRAFYNCTELTRVRIPKTIDHIVHHALIDQDQDGNGKEGVWAGSVSDCYMNPFIGCTGLESIVVDDDNPSMSSVDGVLFNKDESCLYCCPANKKMDYFVVSESVTWIGGNAFDGCKFARLIIKGKFGEKGLNWHSFNGMDGSTVIYTSASEVERIKKIYGGTVLPLESLNSRSV